MRPDHCTPRKSNPERTLIRHLGRRRFLTLLAAASAGASWGQSESGRRYLVSTALFGSAPLANVVPAIASLGPVGVNLVGAHQSAGLGDLISKNGVALAAVTRLDLDPLDLRGEIERAARLGAKTIITAAPRAGRLTASDRQEAISAFAEAMQATGDAASQAGVKVAISNGPGTLLDGHEAIRWWTDVAKSPGLGTALAPQHLPADESALAFLIRDCGERLVVFHAAGPGEGLAQLPGRSPLDFAPMLGALREIGFAGWTSLYLDPDAALVPGGPGKVAAVLREVHKYLEAKWNG